jgi:hypothetical protein
MEPRPQRQSRATGPYISTGTPNPPGSGQSGTGFSSSAFDASSAPPAPPPSIGYDPDYSPGQPLTPLRGPRGANIVGPLLAVAALAIIVAAVAFIVSQFRDGNDNNTANPTSIAAAGASPTSESDEGGDDPTDQAAGNADSPTDEASGDGAEATNTPRLNRSTEAADDTSGSTDTSSDSSSSGDDPSTRTRARQWLPTTDDIGEGFSQSENGTRTQEEVINSFPESADAATRLEEFGWKENAFRNFELEGGADTDTTGMTVSVHRFESESGAKEAMPFFAEGSGLETVKDAPELGEESITLQGQLTGGNAYVIYIRQDEFVLRIGGFSATGDPSELTTRVAEQMMGT